MALCDIFGSISPSTWRKAATITLEFCMVRKADTGWGEIRANRDRVWGEIWANQDSVWGEIWANQYCAWGEKRGESRQCWRWNTGESGVPEVQLDGRRGVWSWFAYGCYFKSFRMVKWGGSRYMMLLHLTVPSPNSTGFSFGLRFEHFPVMVIKHATESSVTTTQNAAALT